MPAERPHRLIQEICRDPEKIRRLRENLDRLMDDYGLSAEEREALKAGTYEAMGRIGIHPILQMHFMFAMNPGLSDFMSLREYPALLAESGEN